MFFDDMAELGALFWFKWGVVAYLIGIATQGIIPYSYLIGLVLSINLLVAGFITVWWVKRGRQKYATTTITDIGRAKQQQRQQE